MGKPEFKDLTIEQKIEKINNIILHLSYDQKIDVCTSCRNKNGDFKEYNSYIQDGGFCSVCLNHTEVLNYTVIDLIEQADISIADYFTYHAPNGEIYSGLRKTLSDRDIDIIKIEHKMERDKTMSDEHIKLAKVYRDFGVTEQQLTPMNTKTTRLMGITYFFFGIVFSIIVYFLFKRFPADFILRIIETLGYCIISVDSIYRCVKLLQFHHENTSVGGLKIKSLLILTFLSFIVWFGIIYLLRYFLLGV